MVIECNLRMNNPRINDILKGCSQFTFCYAIYDAIYNRLEQNQ